MPQTDTYIEKDSAVNEEIDKLRHSATAALFERKDVIIVASVSCIYGLGDPDDYSNLTLSIRPGMQIQRRTRQRYYYEPSGMGSIRPRRRLLGSSHGLQGM